MPKKLPRSLLDTVKAQLAGSPAGLDIDELSKRLESQVSRRSLQRKLAEWSRAGAIRIEGAGKARRYLPALSSPVPQVSDPGASVTEGSKALSLGGREVRELVRRPIIDRPPVGYRREFLDGYEPNASAYLPETVIRHLNQIGRVPGDERPAGTFAHDILNRLLIDLSWASSRLEGNTYSLLETQQLIEAGQPAPGKDVKETQMILNHKAAIEMLVDSAEEVDVNRFTILNLHALLAERLLDDPRQAGRLRETPVGIGGSSYIPTGIPQLIQELFGLTVEKAAAIREPFEQSFFLLVQLPYLQPFVDVNKRTSRLAANIPLIKRNRVPLSFVDLPEDLYTDGVIGVYELNRIELLRDAYVWAYERSCRRYAAVRDSIPPPDPFRIKYKTALIEVVGEIVRQNLDASAESIAALASSMVDAADFPPFVALAMDELRNLHEGNIARYRLRPSQWEEWKKRMEK
jgi:Fic/DOC family